MEPLLESLISVWPYVSLIAGVMAWMYLIYDMSSNEDYGIVIKSTIPILYGSLIGILVFSLILLWPLLLVGLLTAALMKWIKVLKGK